MYIYIARLR